MSVGIAPALLKDFAARNVIVFARVVCGPCPIHARVRRAQLRLPMKSHLRAFRLMLTYAGLLGWVCASDSTSPRVGKIIGEVALPDGGVYQVASSLDFAWPTLQEAEKILRAAVAAQPR